MGEKLIEEGQNANNFVLTLSGLEGHSEGIYIDNKLLDALDTHGFIEVEFGKFKDDGGLYEVELYDVNGDLYYDFRTITSL